VVADALHGRFVTSVQEFNAARWTPPIDLNAPFIGRIEVFAKKRMRGTS
jgi:hypothetical protein